jgi:hypothetical protein
MDEISEKVYHEIWLFAMQLILEAQYPSDVVRHNLISVAATLLKTNKGTWHGEPA